MPRKELKDQQLKGFRKQLEGLRAKILHDIKNMQQANSPDNEDAAKESGHAMHIADVASDMYDREFNLNLASNDRELLQKIENALKRIEDGTYGLCLKTNKPIPIARLKAIPYAEYTVETQEEEERNGSGNGDGNGFK